MKRAEGFEGFDAFLREVCPPLGLEWRKYRRRSARRRVLGRIGELGLENFSDYISHLSRHRDEAGSLAELMRVTVTRFYRERDCWEELCNRFLPGSDAVPGRRPVRAWSVGCCGGEEPYTLSMAWRELPPRRAPRSPLEITATDIDGASLARASARLYGTGSLREVPAAVRSGWFRREGSLWRLDDEAASPVRFLLHDFMREAPPGRFDIVLCRYLAFTYYRGEKRLDACSRLASALEPEGLLFTGKKEGLGPGERAVFEPLSERSGLFRRRSARRRSRPSPRQPPL